MKALPTSPTGRVGFSPAFDSLSHEGLLPCSVGAEGKFNAMLIAWLMGCCLEQARS
ncbi:MAG: hypothetical protein ABSG14_10600 [Verrucomicrobiia bacterium]|jgi:hypothetical protein